MSTNEFSFERLLFGNEHWSTPGAIDEIQIYCDLLDQLQLRVDALETRGKSDEATLLNVQGVISNYAFELAMKSLWALDNSDQEVPKNHNLLKIFDELSEEAVKSLERFGLTREVLEYSPEPFKTNRYPMERRNNNIEVPRVTFLRSVTILLGDKLDESRETLLKPSQKLTD